MMPLLKKYAACSWTTFIASFLYFFIAS
jgi:hypothetical protein